MARGDQLGRQWKIMQTLISSKLGRSASDLARDLDCHPRTVYRYLEALHLAGFSIYTERVEGKNIWSLLETVKHHIPIPLSITELMALHFSSGMLKVFEGTVFHDSLESFFAKVKATLPPGSVDFNEIRMFAVDRIKMLATAGERSEVSSSFDPKEFTERSFGVVYRSEATRVRIFFSASECRPVYIIGGLRYYEEKKRKRRRWRHQAFLPA